MVPVRRPILVAAALAALLACSTSQNETRAAAPEEAGDQSAAAKVGDETITVGELDAWIKDALFQQATGQGDPAKTHELRQRAIEQMVRERLLEEAASARGSDTNSFVAEELSQRAAVSDEEVKAHYEAHKDQYANVTLEQAAPTIRRNLERGRQEKAFEQLLGELRSQAGVEVLLDQPRAQVAASGPAVGPEDAPITIVEFSDYQCPFCRRAEATVKQVLEKYPGQVRFVYRHFPLESIHSRARAAAEASACADEQGRFWEYHDLVFANSSKLEEEDLLRYAEQAGLDLETFRSCVEEGRTRAVVARDMAEGRKLGVSGTPAFFVNGIRLTGAQPLSSFDQIIERELAAAGAAKPAGQGGSS